MRTAIALALLSMLTFIGGCASVSEAVPIAPDTYMIASQGVVGNGSGAAQKADALKAANAFCAKRSKQIRVLEAKTEEPFFGRAPSAEVTFRCEAP